MEAWLTDIGLYLALGAGAGIIAGLLGLGGGVVIVPVLIAAFTWRGFDPAVLTHLAVGSSLATIVATGASAVWAHHRRGAVRWPTFARLLPGIALGTALGAVLADALSGVRLQQAFGLFALLVAAQMLSGWRPAGEQPLPGRWGLAGSGVAIGGVSALFGIGGGSLTVPLLSYFRVALPQAVATAAACGLPIAVVGAASFAVTGWDEAQLPPLATGYLYWPAIGGIVLASMPAARLGAHWAHRLPVAWLRRLFAGFLVLVGLQFLFGAMIARVFSG